jgi:hypothetical protein
MSTRRKPPEPKDTPLPPPAPEPQNPERGAGQVQLPAELVQAMVADPDPYLMLGREYARRIQLEGVVEAMTTYLKRLVIEAAEEEERKRHAP